MDGNTEAIKTYSDVNREDPLKSFGISRMEDIYKKHNGQPDAPHRHDFYTILLVKQAEGKHLIDFHEFTLAGRQVHFIGPGQVHQVIEEQPSLGYSMVFSMDFLMRNSIPLGFIDDLNLFRDYGYSPPLEPNDEQMQILTAYCEEIIRYARSGIKFSERAIGALLALFLIKCNDICALPPDNPQRIEAGNVILKHFRELVESYYTTWHTTSWYAEQLHISPDHLNRTIKSLIGKTAKEYIQSRISVEARRMLYFSGLSAKEIGYRLGFSEPANFSSFFKKCTGLSPSHFKQDHIGFS